MRKHYEKFESLLKYLVAAILIAVPLYPKFPFIRIPSTFVSIRLEDLLLLVSFAVFVITIYIGGHIRKVIFNPIFGVVIFYLLVGLVSLISAIFVTKTVTPHIALLHWLRRIEYFIPFFLGYYVILRDKRRIDYYLIVLVFVVFLIFLYGIGQRYLQWPIVITQNEEYSKGIALRWIPGSHINSTFAGHYDLATFLVVIIPLSISLFYVVKGTLLKALLLIDFLGGLWLLVSSASRISFFSYLVSLSLVFLLTKNVKKMPLVIIVSLVFTLFSTNLISRYARIIEVISDKISSSVLSQAYAYSDTLTKDVPKAITEEKDNVLEDRSTNIRLNVEWPRAIRAFLKNPLLGTGYSSITLATDNDYLRLIGETGLLGFVAFLHIFLRLGLAFYKWIASNKEGMDMVRVTICSIIGSSFGVFTNAFFIDVFEASKFAIIFWLLVGFSYGLVKYDE